MKTKKLLFLAIVSGLMTTLLFYLFINRESTAPADATVPMATVVTAGMDISKNEKMTKENLSAAEFPEDQIHPDAVRDPESIIGKYASADIKQGEIIMLHRVYEAKEEEKVISRKISEGYRAVSISTDFVKSVSNQIEPEDLVDVVLSEETPSGDSGIKTELILEKVRVLSVGKRLTEKQNTEAGTGSEPEYLAVTLELKQEDSVKIINSSERGNLHLVLNSQLSSKEEAETGEQEEQVNPEPDIQLVTLSKRSIIRKKPHLNGYITSIVDQDTKLKFLEKQETDEEGRLWLFIETPDKKQGWISSRIVKQEGE
ncbi:Flp pilus assembly protein CpaB [Cytobacillus oceanisediminis]|uniref:Flp pilus assembly protein CpaB n=1 Tax=Cytobacillus oceanisediminis TaxID=665099 RepID=A0A2V2ZRV2_9BACI|nr:Flp pilus assembly protein CpaB [Cytobacillus oceanisediminis]PWW27053.1 Flp pilus assembly protein CpaB [Cytobacillus oceanisediminis]